MTNPGGLGGWEELRLGGSCTKPGLGSLVAFRKVSGDGGLSVVENGMRGGIRVAGSSVSTS